MRYFFLTLYTSASHCKHEHTMCFLHAWYTHITTLLVQYKTILVGMGKYVCVSLVQNFCSSIPYVMQLCTTAQVYGAMSEQKNMKIQSMPTDHIVFHRPIFTHQRLLSIVFYLSTAFIYIAGGVACLKPSVVHRIKVANFSV